jgi:hypothetical protein
MISVNDFKTGLTISVDNGIWKVIDFQPLPGFTCWKSITFQMPLSTEIVKPVLKSLTEIIQFQFKRRHLELGKKLNKQ